MRLSSDGPSASSRALALLALLGTAALSACGTHADNGIGVALIEDRGNLKAVRLITATPPDTSTSYQVLSVIADNATTPTLLVSGRPGYLSRALLRFAPSNLPLPGSVVDSASLVLPYRQGFGTSPFSMTISRVTSTWPELPIPADSFPSVDPAPFATVDVPFADPVLDTLRVSLAGLVQAWVSDSTSNFGMALAPATGAAGEIQFDSREGAASPRLSIHFHTAGGPPESTTAVPVADVFSLGTTPAFTPLDQEPRRITVARGFPAHALVRFTWPDLGPRATVHRAELTLYVDAARSSGRDFAMGVRFLKAEPWTGSTTAVDATIYGNASVSAAADSAVLDVTSVLDRLLSNPNHGFEIRAVDEHPNTDYIRFHGYDTEVPGKAPVLRIWYTPGDLPEDNP